MNLVNVFECTNNDISSIQWILTINDVHVEDIVFKEHLNYENIVDCVKNHRTNRWLVCTHFDAFFMVIPNMDITINKFWNFWIVTLLMFLLKIDHFTIVNTRMENIMFILYWNRLKLSWINVCRAWSEWVILFEQLIFTSWWMCAKFG